MFTKLNFRKFIFYELNAVTSFKNYTKIIKFSLQFNLKINVLDILFLFQFKMLSNTEQETFRSYTRQHLMTKKQ